MRCTSHFACGVLNNSAVSRLQLHRNLDSRGTRGMMTRGPWISHGISVVLSSTPALARHDHRGASCKAQQVAQGTPTAYSGMCRGGANSAANGRPARFPIPPPTMSAALWPMAGCALCALFTANTNTNTRRNPMHSNSKIFPKVPPRATSKIK